MIDLSMTYMGLKLKNPIVVASSSLGKSVEGVTNCEKAGAGTAVVRLCSTLYLNGLERIGEVLDGLNSWKEHNGFDSIEKFRGRMSQSESDNPELYERLQYAKALVGIE